MDSRDPRRFPETIGAKEARKLKARREAHHSLWFGMGMFGVVGWSGAPPSHRATLIPLGVFLLAGGAAGPPPRRLSQR